MSITAAFTFQNYPILLGDLMISGNEPHNNTLNVPTFGDITSVFPKGARYIPIGLTQNLAVINENLAVAWSGSKLLAKIINTDLLQQASKKPYWAHADLSDFFSITRENTARKSPLSGLAMTQRAYFPFHTVSYQ